MSKDIQGVELEIGDEVIYGEQMSGPRTLEKDIVTKVTPKGVKVVRYEAFIQSVNVYIIKKRAIL